MKMANSKDPDDDDKDAVDTIALVREAFVGLLVLFFVTLRATYYIYCNSDD